MDAPPVPRRYAPTTRRTEPKRPRKVAPRKKLVTRGLYVNKKEVQQRRGPLTEEQKAARKAARLRNKSVKRVKGLYSGTTLRRIEASAARQAESTIRKEQELNKKYATLQNAWTRMAAAQARNDRAAEARWRAVALQRLQEFQRLSADRALMLRGAKASDLAKYRDIYEPSTAVIKPPGKEPRDRNSKAHKSWEKRVARYQEAYARFMAETGGSALSSAAAAAAAPAEASSAYYASAEAAAAADAAAQAAMAARLSEEAAAEARGRTVDEGAGSPVPGPYFAGVAGGDAPFVGVGKRGRAQ